MLLFNYSFTVDDNLITFNRNYFTSVFIYEIFCPCFKNTSSEFSSYVFLKISLVTFNGLRKFKDFEDIFIIFKAYSSQQSSNRQFLFTVDIRIHHSMDICCEFDP